MILCVLKHFWANNKKLRVFYDAHSRRQVFAFSRVCNFISGAAAELQTWTEPLSRRYRNLGKSVSQNHWQYVSIYNLQRKPDTIVSQANRSKDHQFNVEGRIVEVFLDAKEDRGASCSVWTLGLTSFWQPTAHPTCNIQQAKTGAKTQSICRNCNAWNSSSSSPMRFVAQNSPTFSEWTF